MLKRSVKVTFRLSDQEFKRLKQLVKKTGYSQEHYLRSVIFGRIPKALPPIDYYGMMRELNAIGNNLHQISARANKTGFFLAEKYDENYKQLMEKVLEIQAAATLPEKVLD